MAAMSQNPGDRSGWVSLHAHLEALAVERDERYDQRFELQNQALVMAKSELERRLDLLNHAQAEARRVQDTYVPREVYDRSHNSLVERVTSLEKVQSELAGAERQGQAGRGVNMWVIGLVVTVILSAIGNVAVLLTRH